MNINLTKVVPILWASRSRLVASLGLLAVIGVINLTFLPSAYSCSCKAGPEWSWPRAEAVDFPTNGTFIAVSNEEKAETFEITADGGAAIPLQEVAVLEGQLCTKRTIFLRPEQDLTPNTTYTLKAARVDSADSQEAIRTVTTGVGPAPAVLSVPHVDVHILASFTADERFFEAFVSSSAEGPVIVQISGEESSMLVTLGTAVFAHEAVLPLGSVDCAQVKIFDAHGSLVETRSLCTPEKCVAISDVAVSSCDYHKGSYLFESWQDVSGACVDGQPVESDPPAVEDAGVTQDGSAVMGNGPAGASGGGCTFAGGQASNTDRGSVFFLWQSVSR